MSVLVNNLRWLGNQLKANAADLYIEQGSEGARYCWEAANEIESLRHQLSTTETRIDGVKQQRDVERVSYLNEFEKNQVIVAENAKLRQQLAATEPKP